MAPDAILVWTAVGSCASAVTSGGVLLAIRQIAETTRSTNAEIAVDLFRELRSDDALKMTREIYELVPEDHEKFDKSVRDHIDYLTDRLNLLGGLVGHEVVAEKLAIAAYGGPAIIRCWYQLVPYIRTQQRDRGYYIEDYENLVYLTWKRFHKAQVRVGFTSREKVVSPDLVADLERWKKNKNPWFPRRAKDMTKRTS